MNQTQFSLILSISVILLLASSVVADSNNITIIEPSNDNPTISSNFDVIVSINDTLTKSAQVRFIGYPWIPLEQLTTTSWGANINISNYPDGPGELSAKYLRIGEVTWYYVPTTTTIIIKNPVPVLVTGSLQATVTDSLGNPLQDVLVFPTGNKTNTNGIVLLGNQPLNTEINFTFSKNGYINSYIVRTFTNTNIIYQTLTLNDISGNIRKFKVSGYNDYADVGSMFNLKVLDATTGETISGADVKIYDQNEIVMSIPGTTNAKGRVTASFTQAGSFWIGIEKSGFADWESDEILIIAPRTTPTTIPTPTPTPAATPIPTPTPDPSKFRADANMKLTDDEYRVWMQNEEKRQADLNRSSQTTTYIPPPQPEPTPWATYGLVGVLVGAVSWKVIKGKSQGKTDPEFEGADELMGFPGERTSPGVEIKENKERLGCEFCEWTTEVGINMSESLKQAIIEAHCLEEKHGKQKKSDTTGKAVVGE
jgi:hypothetical protein